MDPAAEDLWMPEDISLAPLSPSFFFNLFSVDVTASAQFEFEFAVDSFFGECTVLPF
jgi:hypothetical protein